jgi:hypothetical protein
MQQIILESLIRQAKGTELLHALLREEYALLRGGQPGEVTGLEMVIQELVRQLVREREFLIRRLGMAGPGRLAEFLEGLAPAEREVFEAWRTRIVAHEQESARQTTLNSKLAMALWEQSGNLLRHFQNQVVPRERNTYTAKGTWGNRSATATMVRGRL